MSLCRYLPTPSDRMSVLWSLLAINNAVVLEYGPAGTTHYSMILYGKLGVMPSAKAGSSQSGTLYSTHMTEDDVVMGDVSRLEKAIFEVDQNSNAKVIFVVASSLSAIIGTDIKGVCNEMQEKVNAKLVCFEHGGLKGDYSVGLSETYKLVCKELAKKNVEKKEKTFNIIGLSLGQYRAKSDLWEIKELMKEAFGYTCHASLCENISTDELSTMGCAQINLCIRDEAIAAAKILEKKCGTPYLLGCPYGYQGTLEWLESVSKIINEEINPLLVERLREKSSELKQRGQRRRIFSDYTPVGSVVGDYDRVRGIARLLKEFNFDIDALICDHSLLLMPEKDPAVQYIENEKQRVEILEKCQEQLIFGDDVSLEIVNDTNKKVLVSAPFFTGSVAKHMPIVGEKGSDYLAEHINLYLTYLAKLKN